MCALDYNYGKVMEACQHRRFRNMILKLKSFIFLL